MRNKKWLKRFSWRKPISSFFHPNDEDSVKIQALWSDYYELVELAGSESEAAIELFEHIHELEHEWMNKVFDNVWRSKRKKEKDDGSK
jgi:hypothetical protein